ncbi:MAG: hypothetical protein F9K25_18555 [Candidatus Contendobacter sp.]|nr:MAG: hypothetical protein F9K25_18555 [Candidatus Contendobacter sp.]
MSVDPAVRLETVAAAAGVALFTLRRAIAAGSFPQADVTLGGTPLSIRAWRLSTIRTWNPAVADRCAAFAAILENIPLKKAA